MSGVAIGIFGACAREMVAIAQVQKVGRREQPSEIGHRQESQQRIVPRSKQLLKQPAPQNLIRLPLPNRHHKLPHQRLPVQKNQQHAHQTTIIVPIIIHRRRLRSPQTHRPFLTPLQTPTPIQNQTLPTIPKTHRKVQTQPKTPLDRLTTETGQLRHRLRL